MINVERLEAKLKEAGLNVKYRKPNELTLQKCPLHRDKTPSVTINTEKGRFRCFSCNERGSISKFLSYFGIKYGYYSEAPTVDELEKLLLESESDNFGKETEENKYIADPNELSNYRFYHPYLESRGLTKEFCLKNKIGFDKTALRVTIPMFFRGEYMGCARRSVAGDIPKISYNSGMPKDQMLYLPLTNTNKTSQFLLVEGPIDALKASFFGFDSGAILGCLISEKQMWAVYDEADGREIIVALDNDHPGIEGISRVIDKLHGLDNVRIFKYSEKWKNDKGEPVKDIGDCNKEMIEWGIENAVSILEY